MKLQRVIGILLMGVLLARCGGGDTPPPTVISTGDVQGIIQWKRDPLAVIFRADIVGGDRNQVQLNNYIPACTLYGDGRVVYTENNPQGFLDVIFDFVSDEDMTNFVDDLAFQKSIFQYDEGYTRQLPASTVPVYRQIVVEVNGLKHITDDFVQWEGDLYAETLAMCRALAKTPRVFVPTGAWVSATEVTAQQYLPTIFWDSSAAGYAFSSIAIDGSRRWIEGATIRPLWDNIILQPGDIQFDDGVGVYFVSLQVPGVTLDAPAAPAQ